MVQKQTSWYPVGFCGRYLLICVWKRYQDEPKKLKKNYKGFFYFSQLACEQFRELDGPEALDDQF